MARSRLLKPDFFDDEKMADLPFGARLLFEALWTLADREGRLEDRPEKIAAFAFPYDKPIQKRARRESPDYLDALVAAGCVVRYEVNGQRLLWLPNWDKHQKIHEREAQSVLPPAQGMQLQTLGEQGRAQGMQFPPEAVAVSDTEAVASREAEAVAEHAPPQDPFTFQYANEFRRANQGRNCSNVVLSRALDLEREYGSQFCIEAANEKGWEHDPSYYVGRVKELRNGNRGRKGRGESATAADTDGLAG